MEGNSQKAKGTSEDGGRRGFRLSLVPFALCLLPLVLLCGVPFVRREATAPVPLNVEEADEVLRRAAQAALGGRDGAVLVLRAHTGPGREGGVAGKSVGLG